MKKISSSLLALGMLLGWSSVQGQNLVLNPSFEQGATPTSPGQFDSHTSQWSDDCTDFWISSNGQSADIYDVAASSGSGAGIPANNYGTLNPMPGHRRYAHLYSTEVNGNGPGGTNTFEREEIKGRLESKLEAGCYRFCYWAATVETPNSINYQNYNEQELEVVLVEGNNCHGMVIHTTPPIPHDDTWYEYCTTFEIDAAHADMYDRIVIRPKDDNSLSPQDIQSIYVDSLTLTAQSANINISGPSYFCSGQSATLTASAGWDNYLWSNGATSQSTSVNSPGTYTVTVSNNGSSCSFQGSFTITQQPSPKILLPSTIGVCDGNFQFICGPGAPSGSTYSYEWWGPDPILQQSVLLSTDMCFQPSAYGTYLLEVTNDQTGCSSSLAITFTQINPPSVNIEDVYYCGKHPYMVGLPAGYSDAIAYSWTYNGNPINGAYGYQTFNIGDGEYCVYITWENGCVSEACFTVERCCEPDPTFNYEFVATTNPMSLTVWNDPANTPDYDYENFKVYRYCGPNWGSPSWTLITTMGRTLFFDNPHTFTGSMFQEGCMYKIVHTVNSYCLQESFTYTHIFMPGGLKVVVSPNPVSRGETFRVALDSYISGEATVEVINMQTGITVLTGEVSNEQEFTGELNPRGVDVVNYAVRVTYGDESITQQLMVR